MKTNTALQVACLMTLTALTIQACTEDKALIVTGQSMVTLADQFVAVASAMDAALDSKAITPDAYNKWAAFGKKFQAAYPLATHLWQVAVDTQDQTMKQQIVAMVLSMATELGAYAALVGVK